MAVPLHLLWRLLRLPSPWPKWFLGSMARIVGARRRVIGTPLKRDVVFLANHLSWMDIPILAGANGSAFVAKAEVRGLPVVGWLCTLNRTIFVRREDHRRGEPALAEPACDSDERAWILMRRRRVHQHRATRAVGDAEITAEGSIARQRRDLGAGPAVCGKENGGAGGGNHVGRHRCSHAAGAAQVKPRAPSGNISSLSRSASGHACGPARSAHSISSAES